MIKWIEKLIEISSYLVPNFSLFHNFLPIQLSLYVQSCELAPFMTPEMFPSLSSIIMLEIT